MYRQYEIDIGCGPLNACWIGARAVATGQTCGGKECSAKAHLYEVKIPQGGRLELGYMVWSNGERNVEAVNVVGVSKLLRRLEHGLRLGIHPRGSQDWIELGQARIKGDDWAGKFKASPSQLNEGAGVGVAGILKKLGATEIGTKGKILDDDSTRRFYLCAVFGKNSAQVPIAAYILTRILPLINRYTTG